LQQEPFEVSTGRGELSFQFEEFRVFGRYTKNQACLLIQAILIDYGAKELHPIFKTAFLEVSKMEEERISNKRKAAPTRNSSKRSRRDQGDTAHTGQSFGMSNLKT
jgi:hypothetical protein